MLRDQLSRPSKLKRYLPAAIALIASVLGSLSASAASGNISTLVTGQGPSAIATDAFGNIYFAEPQGHRIAKLDVLGQKSFVAGNGSAGFSGDGGPALDASLNLPFAVVVNASGELFIADSANNRIRKVDTSGNISTIAGNGSSPARGETINSSDDGQAATQAKLDFPMGLTLDSAGHLIIADTGNNLVRRINDDATISTIAGNGMPIPILGRSLSLGVLDATFYIDEAAAVSLAAGLGDNGPSTLAILNEPTGLTVDSIGNLYIADTQNNRIRRVDANGTITTVAGTGCYGGYCPRGDGLPAIAASLYFPRGVAFDQQGRLYVSDSGNHIVRRLEADGSLQTIAGNGTFGFSGDGGPAWEAQLRDPRGLAYLAGRGLLIADSGNSRIRLVSD